MRRDRDVFPMVWLGSLVVCVVWASWLILGSLAVDREWNTIAGSRWDLADKSSTLAAKSAYVDEFVASLETLNLQGTYNATAYTNPSNSFDANFAALNTLQGRLHEIQAIDPNSFAYQTAIQQITAQEQGEADDMIGAIEGCWLLKNHSPFWGWHAGVQIVILLLGAFVLLVSAGARWL